MNAKNLEETLIPSVRFDNKGLVPVIVQEMNSNNILILAYANKEALTLTLADGYATFWSRSRNKIWRKGETSGDKLKIYEVLIDCDQDAVLYRVFLVGKAACHTKDQMNLNRKSCFYRKFLNSEALAYLDISQKGEK